MNENDEGKGGQGRNGQGVEGGVGLWVGRRGAGPDVADKRRRRRRNFLFLL